MTRYTCGTRASRPALAIAVWSCALGVTASTARATVGPPVKLRMPADTPMAVAGQTYKGAWEVHAEKAGVISDFTLEGEGWTVQTLDKSLEGTRVNAGVHRIPFTAMPTDPNAPFKFTLKFD